MADLATALRDLIEQFDAYRGGWMGDGIWRDRIGLPECSTPPCARSRSNEPPPACVGRRP